MKPVALREDAPIEHRLLRPFHRFRGLRIARPSSAPSKDYWAASPRPHCILAPTRRLHRLATAAIADRPPASSVLHRCPLRSVTFQDRCRCRGAIAAAFDPRYSSAPSSLPPPSPPAVPPTAISAPRPSRCHRRPPRPSALRDPPPSIPVLCRHIWRCLCLRQGAREPSDLATARAVASILATCHERTRE
jgi:hypothetical protein